MRSRRGNIPRWLLWVFVAVAAGFAADAADLRGVRRNVDADVQPADAVPKLDMTSSTACRGSAGGSCRMGSRHVHFDAVLVSMLTTWTRRLIGSIGALASLGLSLP